MYLCIFLSLSLFLYFKSLTFINKFNSVLFLVLSARRRLQGYLQLHLRELPLHVQQRLGGDASRTVPRLQQQLLLTAGRYSSSSG